jgi:hypothetical protein
MSSLNSQVLCELYIDGVGGSWFKPVNLPCVPQAEACFFFGNFEDQFTVSSFFFSENSSGGFDVVVLFNEAISEEISHDEMMAWGWEWEPEHAEATDGTQAR